MKLEASVANYRDNTIFFGSHSQVAYIQEDTKCKRYWYWKYYEKKKGERVFTKPFDYGTYAHSVMEDLMKLPINERVGMIETYINSVGNVYDSYRKTLFKALPHIIQRVTKYDNVDQLNPQTELELGIVAPDEWFPVGYDKFLDKIAKSRGRTYNKMGFRSIIDYYGVEVSTNEETSVDWKSSKWYEQYGQGYINQLNEYDYVLDINGLHPKKSRLEFIEQPIKNNATKEFKHQPKKGKELIYKALNNTLIQLQIAYENNKPFRRTESDFNCNSCAYNVICKKSDLIELYFGDEL